MSRRPAPFAAAALLSAALLAGCGGGDENASKASSPGARPTSGIAAGGTPLVRGALSLGLPSVVSVSVSTGGTTAIGNGTVVLPNAVLVDSFLVSGPGGVPKSGIVVRDAAGSEYPAVVDGVDRVTRLAALRVRGLEATPPAAGGDPPLLGAELASIAYLSAGNANVRPGVVVTTNRTVRAGGTAEVGLFEVDGSLGTTAVGAPVVDGDGRARGITTRAVTPRVSGAAVAVPYGAAKRIATALHDFGRVRRAYLGVQTVEVTPSRAKELQLKTSEGLMLRSTTPGSPAAIALLREPTGTTTIAGKQIPTGGDVIVALSGTKVSASEDLDAALLTHKPGDRVTVQVIRGDRSVKVPVTLGER